ncbi:MAG: 4Fe-4S binding protein [Bacteroidetes bacterium]|nr:4Fe-4S binding protein [Bacteroidota bacterium]
MNSANNNVKKKRAVAFVDSAYCTGCAICAAICPVKCIEIVESSFNFTGEAKVSLEICTGCNLCAIDCPWEAISMINPDGSIKEYSKQLFRVRGYV